MIKGAGCKLKMEGNGNMDKRKAFGFGGFACGRFWVAGIVALLALLLVFGCASKRKGAVQGWVEIEEGGGEVETSEEGEGTEDQGQEAEKKKGEEERAIAAEEEEAPKEVKPRRVVRKGIDKVPSYGLFYRSLKRYERELGIEFYKDSQGRYMPFAAYSWDSFSIADSSGECLYDIEVVGVKKTRLDVILDLEVSQGPCGLKYPNTDAAVMERVSTMEGSVVSYELIDQLNGFSFCSDKKFLQKVLQVPFALEHEGRDLESSLQDVAMQITNPLDISFGDIVFFEPYTGEQAVGIYVGYGVVVYHTCFGAKIHYITPKRRYRIYRIFTGFAWTRYKLHQEKFMADYMGVEE